MVASNAAGSEETALSPVGFNLSSLKKAAEYKRLMALFTSTRYSMALLPQREDYHSHTQQVLTQPGKGAEINLACLVQRC